ncbi:MAG TPA: hypothetical protein VG755_31080 [Nannocystaceae bacterium]|nr:hypothetical protein [Nannocystaceae bacterium]
MKIVALALSLSLVPLPLMARAEPPSAPEVPSEITNAEARAHFSTGMKAWLADDLATAQRELEAAYAIDDAPVLLYAIGQLERLQGRCDLAREKFVAYLATDPPDAAAEDARANLERCGGAPTPEPPPPEPVPESKPDVPPPEPTPQPRRIDRLGIALTVVGSAIAVGGFGVFGAAFAEQKKARDAMDVGGFDRRVQRARIEHATGLTLASVGAALLIGGIVRLALTRRRAAPSHRSARTR